MSESKVLFKPCGEGEVKLTWETEYEDPFIPKTYFLWYSPWARMFIVERNDGAFFYLRCLKSLDELSMEDAVYIRSKLNIQPWALISYEHLLQIPGERFVKQVYLNDYPNFDV